ncbi:MAG: flagellar basal body P-ring formation protein FlgA [Lentisphaeria bacterium]|nr:flagellar basal body P-ring formation chaperone FlgA [Lentisphaeria bacterium]NQZ70019.1 flagellar basal body P-ring formation protein FlgA [Lentisphaeria bacterium]
MTKLISLFIFIATLSADNVRLLNIKSKINCSKATITLGDISLNTDILSDDELDIIIMSAPQKSKTKRVSILTIANLMQPYEELHDINIRGPQYITIIKIADPEQIEKVYKAISQYLAKTAPWDKWTVDALFSTGDKRQISKAGAFHKVKVLSSRGIEKVGNVNLNIAYYDKDGGLMKKESFHPVIVKQVNAVVVRSSLARKHIIIKDDIQIVPSWLGKDGKDIISKIDHVLGRELKRQLSSGAMIKYKDLLNPIIVKRGDLVKVHCRYKKMYVTISAIAMESGRLGQSIKVKNASSKELLNVNITGPKVAKFNAGI